RRHPDGWQGFLTQSGRKIRRQDMRGEILNRLLAPLCGGCAGGCPCTPPEGRCPSGLPAAF
ncbi:MAG: hypothetical protein HFG09_04890, partial [Oscillibacter sp.]|nr:hypothetical protein [Oscillibacter sp.]